MSPSSSALPRWHDHPEELTPEQRKAAELAQRERSMPPHLRSTNPKKRDLRDAYLGLMTLAEVNDPTQDQMPALTFLAAVAQRDAARVELRKILAELEAGAKPEWMQWAKEAAKELFSFAVQEARREQVRHMR